MLDAPDIRTLKGLRDRAILYTLFYTGCRIADVCKLKMKDLHEDAGYSVLDFIVKGGKRNRVAINQELQIVLSEYLDRVGHELEKSEPLFLAVQRMNLKKHMSNKAIDNIFRHYAIKARLPQGVTPHTARATFITQALERKCPIEAVQRSVGHAKIVTTQMYDKRIQRHRESASLVLQY